MTTREMAQMLDVVGLVSYDGLAFAVKVLDVKVTYGTPRYLVQPVNGTGTVWINADRFNALPSNAR